MIQMVTFELGLKGRLKFPRGKGPRCSPSLQVGYGTEWFQSPAMGTH